jgi:hypothetical protein
MSGSRVEFQAANPVRTALRTKTSASIHGVVARTGGSLKTAAPTMNAVSTRRGPRVSPRCPAGTWTTMPTTADTDIASATSVALKPTWRVK